MNNVFLKYLSISIFTTGICWILNKIIKIKQKKENINDKIPSNEKEIQLHNRGKKLKYCILNYIGSLFPILIIIFIIRCFIYEPYYISFNSMLPNLYPGDYIIVKKFSYSISNPFTNHSIITYHHPQRGDVVIFKLPNDNKLCIKRIIGIPGDQITYNYISKKVIIHKYVQNNDDNTNKLQVKYDQFNEKDKINQINKMKNIQKDVKNILIFQNYDNDLDESYKVHEENINNNKHLILISNRKNNILNELIQKNQQPSQTWTVPHKHYFLMGDNRDDILDSRDLGFIPERNILGQAGYIIINLDMHNSQLPIAITCNRIGKIY